MQCCFDCRYFRMVGRDDPEELVESDWKDGCCEGECRRHPPQVGKLARDLHGDEFRQYGDFPKILGSDWCGEFAPRDNPVATTALPVATRAGAA
jgi:hypothetical protein